MVRRLPVLLVAALVLAVAIVALAARRSADGDERRADPRQQQMLVSGRTRYAAYVRAETTSLRERERAGDPEGARIHAGRVEPARRAGSREPIAVARAAAGMLSLDARDVGRRSLLDVESHTAGAAVAFDAVRDALWARDKGLVGSIDERLAGLRTELDRHRRGEGFRSSGALATADRRRLAAALDAFAWRLGLAADRLAR